MRGSGAALSASAATSQGSESRSSVIEPVTSLRERAASRACTAPAATRPPTSRQRGVALAPERDACTSSGTGGSTPAPSPSRTRNGVTSAAVSVASPESTTSSPEPSANGPGGVHADAAELALGRHVELARADADALELEPSRAGAGRAGSACRPRRRCSRSPARMARLSVRPSAATALGLEAARRRRGPSRVVRRRGRGGARIVARALRRHVEVEVALAQEMRHELRHAPDPDAAEKVDERGRALRRHLAGDPAGAVRRDAAAHAGVGAGEVDDVEASRRTATARRRGCAR